MYFGLYQLANRHHDPDAFPHHDIPRDDTPGLFAMLFAWLRRRLVTARR